MINMRPIKHQKIHQLSRNNTSSEAQNTVSEEGVEKGIQTENTVATEASTDT